MIAFVSPLSSFAQDHRFSIPYEAKGFNVTMTYEEILRYCHLVDSLYPEVRLFSFGLSAQGDTLPYLVIDNGYNSAAKTTLWIQSGIHPGEPEGVDAGFLFLRDLLESSKLKRQLDQVRVVFIPVFNVDGLKRFGPFNRINQNGPEAMGWRTTAQNLNLNRDFMKADAPEMQAWLTLYNLIKPDFLIDCHTTDGADYVYPLTYGLDAYQTLDFRVANWCRISYEPFMKQQMEDAEMPVFPYVAFREWHNPKSGLYTYPSRPMLSHGYTILSDRPCLLIETHMLKPYKVRVEATLKMLHITMAFLAEQGDNYRQLLREADQCRMSEEIMNKPFPISLTTSMKDSVWTEFRGMHYDTVRSAATGGVYYKYDNTRPENWKIPMFSKVVVDDSLQLPLAYVIPAEWTEVIRRLQMHGVTLIRTPNDTLVRARITRLSRVSFPPTPYEGRFRPEYIAEEADSVLLIPENSALVVVQQDKIKVLVWLLDAHSDDSFLKWGFFNAIFEQKEYGEMYVLEPLAEKMFAENPALKEEFERLKSNDQSFASSQWAQMNWIYNHTAWKDPKMNVYPVVKITEKTEYLKLVPLK